MARPVRGVTDRLRAEVATQVDDLIWTTSNGPGDEMVSVRRDSLTTILPLVERGLLEQGDEEGNDLNDLESAIADLRAAVSGPDRENDGGSK